MYRFSWRDKKQKSNNKTIALNLEETGKNPERTLKNNPFIHKCNWKGINYPSGKNDWENTEQKSNNFT